jgi:energy-coupling factor transport system ATP-binding protein
MLKLKDLTFTYSGSQSPALKRINMEIPPGRLVLLTGPSGSGKSTLLHCINGLAGNHYGGKVEGSVSVAGRDIAGKELWEISSLTATVFQNPNTQFFQLNVGDEISFGLESFFSEPEEIEQRLSNALRQAGIENLRRRDLFTLSSGEKQKTALAAILAMDQPLILMDEPTANLDIAAIRELQKIIERLKAQGRTIIISEHRLWYLKDIADDVAVIDQGQIVYNGPTSILESTDFRKKHGLRMWNEPPEIPDIISKMRDYSECDILLKTKSLCGGPGKKTLIEDVNLSLPSNHCFAIMGSNGTGKTMLSRILTGLQKETAGKVEIKGKYLIGKKRIGKIACVSQQADQQLFCDSVINEIETQLHCQEKTEISPAELLKDFDLFDKKDQHPHTLSGGEKQRLAIAAAMISEPDIMIFDEPTSGMDKRRMVMLAEQIEKLCSRGLLILIITHDMELVSLVCRKIFWMSGGTIERTIERKEFNNFFDNLMKDAVERPINEKPDSIFQQNGQHKENCRSDKIAQP